LTDLLVKRLRPDPAGAFLTWDDTTAHLAVKTEVSGRRSWKFAYRYHGRLRWYHIGDASALPLGDARVEARRLTVLVDQGRDPQSERAAERSRGTFADLAERYVEEWAKARNKSWHQADRLVRRFLLPAWGRLPADKVKRADVRALIGKIGAPILANQVLAAASAIFTWAIRQDILGNNPCKLVDRNPTQARERVLSDSEIPAFWEAFGRAGLPGDSLKLILLTGQRPGEISAMRPEDIADGWWTLRGDPVGAWQGTKNKRTHRVWLPEAARALVGERGRRANLTAAMARICKDLGVERVTPHDLRRTFSTRVVALGFGRDAMNRVTNHREGGIADVYDRHDYAEENKRVMEAVARHILDLAEGGPAAANVVRLTR
jgi:integrase